MAIIGKLATLYLLALVFGIWLDPGIGQFFHQIEYAVREGENITPQIATVLLSTGILISPLLIASKRSVFAYLTFLFVCIVTGLTFIEINGKFTDWEAKLIINEFGFAGGAVSTFINPILGSIAIALLFVGSLYFAKQPIFKRKLYLLGIIPWGLPVLYAAVANGGDNIRHAQIAIKVPTQILFEFFNPYPVVEARNKPLISPQSSSNTHIVYLIDESIRGDLLSINGGDLKNTPNLNSLLKNNNSYNYGTISSTTNCSATSNLLLRTGVQPQQLPDNQGLLFSNPSLFDYASNAKYRTYYYDGQVNSATRPQNFFSTNEISSIDNYLPIKTLFEVKQFQIDHLISTKIIEQIKNSAQPTFTYVNKFGTHFPYENTYPDPLSNATNKEHYLAALGWTVDNFLNELITGLNNTGKKVVVIYTSDHGQGLGEKGSLSTHCLPEDPPNFQASVPLIIWGINTDLPIDIAPLKDANYSQFQVASSLLPFMGYTKADLPQEIGNDLSTAWDGDRYFYSGDLTGRGALRKNIFNLNN